MAVVVEVMIPGITRDQYDAIRAEVDWFATVPEGGQSHICWWEGSDCWWEGSDCHGLDNWESEAAFAAFSETRLGPVMAKLGIDAPVTPTFHQPHEVFVPTAVKITAS